MVAAAADDGIAAVGLRAAGNGALYAGNAGGEPDEPEAKPETAADARKIVGIGKQELRR